MRDSAVDAVRQCILSIWPNSRCEVFGSFATGLYLPTSDVDLVIFDSGVLTTSQQYGGGGGGGGHGIQSALRALATKLARQSLATDLQVISKAKVPIIKFKTVTSGVNFDVSFDQASGPQAAGYVKTLVRTLPQMRPLLLVLKVFLQQRDCNEVYTGGIGSYGLLTMIASFLLSHPSKKREGRLTSCLGVLLTDFFLHYGRVLNTQVVGVSCREHKGFFFNKRSRGLEQPDRPYLLCVEDPHDPLNDLGRNSFSFSRVRASFEFAYNQLQLPSRSSESLLFRLMRWEDALIKRPGVDERTQVLIHRESQFYRDIVVLDEEEEEGLEDYADQEEEQDTKGKNRKKKDTNRKSKKREIEREEEKDRPTKKRSRKSK